MSVTVADIGAENVPESWLDAVNVRLNDLHHADQCACRTWPEECASGIEAGRWDADPTALLVAAVVLEPLIRERVAAESETISTQQAASLLGVSRATMVRFLDGGRLPYSKPGKHRRVRVADVLAFKAQTAFGETGNA